MKQLLILSGKGGTGKTTIAGAFIRLAAAKAYADCDVDAPNLHLVMTQNETPARQNYYGQEKAILNPPLCVQCGRCSAHCRFDAMTMNKSTPSVDAFACEGCGVCAALCPTGAIKLVPAEAGTLLLYQDSHHVFSTAQLNMGSGTTGKLVTEVKKQLRQAPAGVELAIIDGSPGIGCPVIASMSGVHLALLVAEPTVSGVSDLKRLIKTAEMLRTPVAVCVNKADTNPPVTAEIEVFCRAESIPFVGTIPFDPQVVSAVNSGRTIAETDCPAGRAVREVYDKTTALLNK